MILIALLTSVVYADCWTDAYSRGEGRPFGECEEGYEFYEGLCYELCPSGFKGIGPLCYQLCPNGFIDAGVECLKPPTYSRGTGYITMKACLKDNDECEPWSALYYPVCRNGFHNVACCACTATCPDGMIDLEVSCQKMASFSRGIGRICMADEEYDDGKCYKKCKENYTGIDSICWGACPKHLHNCGALCVKGVLECEHMIRDLEKASQAIHQYIHKNDTLYDVIDKVGQVLIDANQPRCSSVEFLMKIKQ